MLSPLQIRTLEIIERFGYVTNSQIVGLGVSSYRVVARNTQHLTNLKVIKKYSVGVHTRLGRCEDIHVLSRKGADILKEFLRLPMYEFRFRDRKPLIGDFFHRKYCVDFHMAIWKLLQDTYPHLEVSFWKTYFQKNGGANHCYHDKNRPKLQSITHVIYDPKRERAFIPDIIFQVQNPQKGKRLLYAGEVTNSGKTVRSLQQIWRHSFALSNRAIGKKFGKGESHLVLCLFSKRSWMETVQHEFGKLCPEQIQSSFFFNTTKDLQRHPEAWLRGTSKSRTSILSLQPIQFEEP